MPMGWGKAFKRKRDAHMVVHPSDVFLPIWGMRAHAYRVIGMLCTY